MRNAGRAEEPAHVTGPEHVAYHARGFVHVESGTLSGDDACRVLTAVLKDQQPIVEHLINCVFGDDA
jgi:hypothetical protein